jgi:hypothetical protein
LSLWESASSGPERERLVGWTRGRTSSLSPPALRVPVILRSSRRR